jgi:hypothetical protein
MATTAGGTPYVESSDLVANYPAVSLALAEHIDDVTGGGGLSLVTPTSIANSGGSASVSGGAVTFSGITSLSLNGVFTSTYENYLVTLDSIPSVGGNLSFRLRGSGSDLTGSVYSYQIGYAVGPTFYASQSASQTSINLSYQLTQLFMDFRINKPAIAATKTMFISSTYGGTSAEWRNVGAYVSQATAYDGFTLFPVSGNMAGTVRVYGYQNS